MKKKSFVEYDDEMNLGLLEELHGSDSDNDGSDTDGADQDSTDSDADEES